MGHGLARAAAGAAAMLTALGFVASAEAQGPRDDAALVARGEYLARAADCAPCHTGDASKPFAGGLALKTPFGTMFSVNITSDRETGIGNWTYAQFKNALHQGIRADGAYLYPGMPFDAFTKIEDSDLEALWAYVRRIAAVKAPNPENELSFPFDVRLGMLAWRELFFAPGYFKPTAGKSAEWNRGAYLVDALGHCSDCHSPRNIMGAIKGKALFTGTEIDGFYAPDIASGALAKTWTKDNLAQFLKTGASPQRGSVFGPMADVIHDSLSYLTDPDIAAIVTYLFDSPPPLDMPAPQKRSPLAPAVYQRAARLYIDNCAACHQPHGTGVAGAIPPLAENPAVDSAGALRCHRRGARRAPGGRNIRCHAVLCGAPVRCRDRRSCELCTHELGKPGGSECQRHNCRRLAHHRPGARFRHPVGRRLRLSAGRRRAGRRRTAADGSGLALGDAPGRQSKRARAGSRL